MAKAPSSKQWISIVRFSVTLFRLRIYDAHGIDLIVIFDSKKLNEKNSGIGRWIRVCNHEFIIRHATQMYPKRA